MERHPQQPTAPLSTSGGLGTRPAPHLAGSRLLGPGHRGPGALDKEAGGGQPSRGEARAPGGPPGASVRLRSYLLQSVTHGALCSRHRWPTWRGFESHTRGSAPQRSALPRGGTRRNQLSCLLRASLRRRSDSSVCSVCLAFPRPGVSEAPHRCAQPCLSLLCAPGHCVRLSHGPSTNGGHGEGLQLKAVRNPAAKDAHISCERAPESWVPEQLAGAHVAPAGLC